MSRLQSQEHQTRFVDEKLPHFFRRLPRFRTKLPLPPFISKKLGEQKAEEVLLTSQKGSWEVKVHVLEGELWFTKGWDDFVLQHRLHEGDFLVFEHNGHFSFNVRMFGPTSCERDFSGESKTDNNNRNSSHVPPQVNIPEHINKVSVKLEVDKDEVPPPTKIQKHDHAHGKPVHKVVNVSSTKHLQFATSVKAYNIRRRSPYMHIPADFCVANGLYHNARIYLKGPSSEQEVSLIVCRGGRTRYLVITKGWPEFIAANHLKVGEICIFKLRSTGSSSNAVVFDVEVLHKST